jgi:thiol-disulfide isomerase/thioredoxin
MRGRVTMFYFWALHDGFSVLEIPNLNKVVDTFRNQNVNFIAICRDDSAKWDKRAETFFHFRHILRSKNLIGKFDCRPVAIIFDRNGKAVVSLDFA